MTGSFRYYSLIQAMSSRVSSNNGRQLVTSGNIEASVNTEGSALYDLYHTNPS